MTQQPEPGNNTQYASFKFWSVCTFISELYYNLALINQSLFRFYHLLVVLFYIRFVLKKKKELKSEMHLPVCSIKSKVRSLKSVRGVGTIEMKAKKRSFQSLGSMLEPLKIPFSKHLLCLTEAGKLASI